jgi:hypothetical protein
MKYYKFLTKDHLGPYSDFDYTEYLPTDKPGKWLPALKYSDIVICENGYHACKREDVLEWINAEMYEVEFSGHIKADDDKVAGYKVRFVRKIETWNEKTARLFAVWCAREALKLVDNPDPRSIAACDVAERYANGEATDEELAAARAAAWDSARDAAGAAARAAAWAAAWDAAGAAARAAAWYAAGAAVRYAAWYAARDSVGAAQVNKLFEMLGEEL